MPCFAVLHNLLSIIFEVVSIQVLAFFGLETSSSAACVIGVFMHFFSGTFWILANPHLKEFTKV